ncbi:hypothetical protein FG2_0696 [Lactococcus cremoris]|nr:hypothetical protein LLCHP_2175 [Lactococcus cremoris subsp. cremoris HP]KZK13249.1 hypothetical protein AB995_0730 [Lactococcus cremoris]KZK41176.1 hypothetical protein LMG6897_1110 [Lactococcus cremoris]KZK49082.1 hypothetical protein FG2_0696 [Lactococcus cremoris]
MLKMIKKLIHKFNWFIRLIEQPDALLVYAFDEQLQPI